MNAPAASLPDQILPAGLCRARRVQAIVWHTSARFMWEACALTASLAVSSVVEFVPAGAPRADIVPPDCCDQSSRARVAARALVLMLWRT